MSNQLDLTVMRENLAWMEGQGILRYHVEIPVPAFNALFARVEAAEAKVAAVLAMTEHRVSLGLDYVPTVDLRAALTGPR